MAGGTEETHGLVDGERPENYIAVEDTRALLIVFTHHGKTKQIHASSIEYLPEPLNRMLL